MGNDYKPLAYGNLKTYSIHDRYSKVDMRDFSTPWKKGSQFSAFLDSLPSILAGNDLRSVIAAISRAVKHKRPVCFAMGGHVIKTGMSPIVIDLMEKKIFTLLAMNGSGIIHDLETAMMGRTSEDVDQSLGNGSFGMARETSAFLNQAIKNAKTHGMGLGRAVGELILAENLPHKALSLTATGAALDIPVTVHVAIGTDIIHMHPDFDASACGAASHDDFKRFAATIADLENGVFINAGSAVILPEVFLKAVTLVRNLGHQLDAVTTVNLDFIRQYRPMTNVVNRPTLGKGKGFSIIGHHEILIPLIAAGVIESV
ncbi:hypothetical protein [Desulfobacula sp.]|uniref:hypothetical protein n=1 Tax=Desulfobacula sp. TaxID=2593537 RepID=UPI002605581A|nr:hypothetical protein [Desulfobacula sp.]